MVEVSTWISDDQYFLFEQTAAAMDITPAEALRVFIDAFNENKGFPYKVNTSKPTVDAFSTEEEASEFATSYTLVALDQTR